MKKILVLIIFAFIFVVNSIAVPADPRPQTITQPNGKQLTFRIFGDERINWAETLDGYTLLNGEEGYLEFACVDENGTLQPSGILACNPEDRDEVELSFLQDIPHHLFFSKQQIDRILEFDTNQ